MDRVTGSIEGGGDSTVNEITSPVEPSKITGYTPIDRVVGMVAVIVVEFTIVACNDPPIVRVIGDVKFSPVIVTGTLSPCTVLVGDML